MNATLLTANAEMLINEVISYLEQTIMGPEGDAFLGGLAVLSGIAVILIAFGAVMSILRWV